MLFLFPVSMFTLLFCNMIVFSIYHGLEFIQAYQTSTRLKLEYNVGEHMNIFKVQTSYASHRLKEVDISLYFLCPSVTISLTHD